MDQECTVVAEMEENPFAATPDGENLTVQGVRIPLRSPRSTERLSADLDRTEMAT
jgi:hypothetical protein